MANYIEADVVGQKYRRCESVRLSYPIDSGRVEMSIAEQDVVKAGGVVIANGIPAIRLTLPISSLASFEFPILDDNLAPIEGASGNLLQAFALIRSAYVAIAKRRDDGTLEAPIALEA
jgi:hypothetical protein